MAKTEHKLGYETKNAAVATDDYTVAGAGAIKKRASFDSGYHSNYDGGAGQGKGEGTTGETSNNAETTYYPPNGPGKFETPESCVELFDERWRQMQLEAEGITGVRNSNATATSIDNAYTYTGDSKSNSGRL